MPIRVVVLHRGKVLTDTTPVLALHHRCRLDRGRISVDDQRRGRLMPKSLVRLPDIPYSWHSCIHDCD